MRLKLSFLQPEHHLRVCLPERERTRASATSAVRPTTKEYAGAENNARLGKIESMLKNVSCMNDSLVSGPVEFERDRRSGQRHEGRSEDLRQNTY